MSLAALLASASLLVSQGETTYSPNVYQSQPARTASAQQNLQEIRFYAGVDRSNPNIPEYRALFFDYKGIIFRTVRMSAQEGDHPLKIVRKAHQKYGMPKKFRKDMYHKATELFSVIAQYGFVRPNIMQEGVIRAKPQAIDSIDMILKPGEDYEVPIPTDFKNMKEAIDSLEPKK